MVGFRTLMSGLAGGALLISLSSTATVSSEQQLTEMPVRGIVRPLNQASISVDIPVRVAKLHFREAQSFKKGDVLVSFDCERLASEHAALAAVHREMRLVLDRNRYLDKRGAVGRSDVDVSHARVQKAKAEARALAARLKQCKVSAPFDGKVAELRINEHEIPSAGKAFIRIVDETTFEIDLIVPSVWLRTLSPGAALKFVIDETGLAYDAKVARIGATIDPVSQTVKVIATFAHRYKGVMAGMSGTAQFVSRAGGQ